MFYLLVHLLDVLLPQPKLFFPLMLLLLQELLQETEITASLIVNFLPGALPTGRTPAHPTTNITDTIPMMPINFPLRVEWLFANDTDICIGPLLCGCFHFDARHIL